MKVSFTFPTEAVRAIAGIALSRVMVVVTALLSASLIGIRAPGSSIDVPVAGLFVRWDSDYYLAIAQTGYSDTKLPCLQTAFSNDAEGTRNNNREPRFTKYCHLSIHNEQYPICCGIFLSVQADRVSTWEECSLEGRTIHELVPSNCISLSGLSRIALPILPVLIVLLSGKM